MATKITTRLPNHNGNQQPISVEIICRETKCNNVEITVSRQSCSTGKANAHQEAAYRETENLKEQCSERSTCQMLPTSHKPTGMQSTLKSTKQSTKIPLKLPIEKNYEVDRMVTDKDFQSQLPRHAAPTSQCHLPMSTGCKIYSIVHTEAMHKS